MTLDPIAIEKAVHAAGLTWRVRKLPANEQHGLGLLPSDPQKVQAALVTAQVMLRARIRLFPPAPVGPTPAPAPAGGAPGSAAAPPTLLHPADAATTVSIAAAATLPKDMDWRTRGIIGPVSDQGWCGSCVSFCTTGLASAMAWLELGVRDLTLSAADQHFCSSHGANCGGWNEADALGQIKSRGVVAENVLSYMSAFDNPPQGDPNNLPDHLWLAYCRPEINRKERRYRITDYSAWSSSMAGLPFDARKWYLADHGPMAMAFTVYEDFDSYGGGVYKHVTGGVRGGHCVLVVGYSDTNQAWICRNSWGTGFGGPAHADGTGAGFFMIAYGDSNIDDTFYGCHGILVPPASRLAQRVGDVDGDGQTEVLVTSPWGIGILKQAGATMTAPMMTPNGTRFDGWLLNTGDNQIGPLADYDGDGHAEILVTSPWGVGILKLAGATLAAPMMQPNGTRFGSWLLNTADNNFGEAGDYDGDGRAEILVSSPWGLGILKLAGATLAAPMMQPNGTRFGGWLLNTADNQFGPAADYDGDGLAELLVTSPWGLGILQQSGATMAAPMMAPNGTRFGGWLLNTADNQLGIAGRYAGGPQAGILASSPWGLGILTLSGSTLTAPMMQPNGTRFDSWLLNTADNEF